jgi:hypothetical protein
MNRLHFGLLASFAVVLSGCHDTTPGASNAHDSQTADRPTLRVGSSSAQLPADLHFSPADVAYLASADAATRDAAISRRREQMEALQQAAWLTKGYTGSLKKWSISTKRPSGDAPKE